LSTINQVFLKFKLKKKAHKRSPVLENNPQKKGSVKRARIVTPRKPNSARRPVAKILLSNKNMVVAHIPGVGHNIRSHSSVLIRGGGSRDLPGVRYSCIRGVYDFSSVLSKKRRRSIYGTKKPLPESGVKKLRRKFRFN